MSGVEGGMTGVQFIIALRSVQMRNIVFRCMASYKSVDLIDVGLFVSDFAYTFITV